MKLYTIIKKETGAIVDCVWASSVSEAIENYIQRIIGYWGWCAYSKNELTATTEYKE